MFCSVLQKSRLHAKVFDTLKFLPKPIFDQSKEHTVTDLMNRLTT